MCEFPALAEIPALAESRLEWRLSVCLPLSSRMAGGLSASASSPREKRPEDMDMVMLMESRATELSAHTVVLTRRGAATESGHHVTSVGNDCCHECREDFFMFTS